MPLFGTTDYIFMPIILCALAGAIFCGVKHQWLYFGITMATVLGLIVVWLVTAIPRWLRRSYYLYKTQGISLFSYPGSPKPYMAEVSREIEVATLSLAYLVPDVRARAAWEGVEVYLVPDIREQHYRGLSFAKVSGLSFGKQIIVEAKNSQALCDTALAHELCHIEAVHKKYPTDYERKISEALHLARKGR